MIQALSVCLVCIFLTSCSPAVERIAVGDYTFEVDVARTEKQRNKGLSGQTKINRGMVFLWQKPVTETFWMKDTHIPLDIAFVSPDWEIISIKPLEPLSPELVGSPLPYIAALEMPAGWFAARGIEAGARVQLADQEAR